MVPVEGPRRQGYVQSTVGTIPTACTENSTGNLYLYQGHIDKAATFVEPEKISTTAMLFDKVIISSEMGTDCSTPDKHFELMKEVNPQPKIGISRGVGTSWVYYLAMVLGFLILELVLFWPGLSTPMVYDSKHFISDRIDVYSQQGLQGAIHLLPGRPLAMASFYGSFVFSGMNPLPFRLVNIGLLLACSIAVFVLLYLVISIKNSACEDDVAFSRTIATLLALIYLAHPLQIYLALYIYQRMALMSSLCLLSSLAFYLGTRCGKFASPFLGYGAAVLLYQIGMFSKPNIFTLPVVLILAEMAFFRPHFKELLGRAALFLLASMPYFVIMKLFVAGPHGEDAHEKWFLELIALYFRDTGLTLKEVVLTQCRVLFSYISSISIPLPSNLPLAQAQVISRSILDPPSTIVSVMGVLALGCTGVWFLWKRPMIGFGMIFFVVTIIPESLLVPQYLYVGYRPLLPMVGLLFVFAGLIEIICRKLADRVATRDLPKVVILALLPVICFMATVTRIQADLWSKQALFWEQELKTFPPYGPNVEKKVYLDAFLNLGDAYITIFQWPKAARAFQKAIEIEPNMALLHNNLGLALFETGQTRSALTHLNRALALDPKMPDAYNNMGLVLLGSGDSKNAVEYFTKAVAIKPAWSTAYSNLGAALIQEGMPSKAIPILHTALQLEPSLSEAHNNLGLAYYHLGDVTRAIEHFQHALALEPQFLRARNNLRMARESRNGNAQR